MGLLSFDLDDEQKRQLRALALAQFGFGLAGARRGQEGQALGRAGLLATEGYQRGLLDTEQRNMTKAVMQQRQAEYQAKQDEAKRKQEAADALQKGLAGVFGGAPPPLAAMAPGGPTPANLGRVEQARAVNPEVMQYRNAARFHAAMGNDEAAKRMADIAKDLEAGEEYSTTPHVGVDGSEAYNFLVNKRGGTRKLNERPAPDNREVNTGGQKRILDFRTLAPGTAFDVTMDAAQRDASVRGWAAHGLAKNADARAAAAESRAASEYGKPSIITTQDGGIFSVDPRARTGAPVMGPDGQPLSKGDKPLTETQAKATALANQMAAATAQIAELAEKQKFTGRTLQEQIATSLAGSKGVPYTVGTAAIPKMIAGPNAQKYRQAELQWSEAMLRFLTGAAAPDSEVERNADTYFPRPGDTPEVVEQKRQMRAKSEESVRLAASRAGNKQLPAMPSGGTAPSAEDVEAEMRRRGLK